MSSDKRNAKRRMEEVSNDNTSEEGNNLKQPSSVVNQAAKKPKIESSEDEKLNRRRRTQRENSQRLRDRIKEYIQDLQEKKIRLQAENERIRRQNAFYESELRKVQQENLLFRYFHFHR